MICLMTITDRVWLPNSPEPEAHDTCTFLTTNFQELVFYEREKLETEKPEKFEYKLSSIGSVNPSVIRPVLLQEET